MSKLRQQRTSQKIIKIIVLSLERKRKKNTYKNRQSFQRHISYI